MEVTCIEEHIHDSKHHKGCKQRHDHVEEEDHSCAEIAGKESCDVSVNLFKDTHRILF